MADSQSIWNHDRPEDFQVPPPLYEATSSLNRESFQASTEARTQSTTHIEPTSDEPSNIVATLAPRPILPATSSFSDSSRSSIVSPSITIATSAQRLKSGFPYQSELFNLHIPPQDWEKFNTELRAAAKPDIRQTALAITTGVGLGCILLEPVTSTYIARRVWHAKTLENVKHGVEDQTDEKKVWGMKRETVGAVLRRWNAKWALLGVEAGLEIPLKRKEIGDVKGLEKEEKKRVRTESKRFRVVLYKRGDLVGNGSDFNLPNGDVVAELQTIERPLPEIDGTAVAEKEGSLGRLDSKELGNIDGEAESYSKEIGIVAQSPVELPAN